MRLTSEQVNIIKKTVNTLCENAEVKLFGSRLDDNAKGGDIDLLISLKEPIEHPAKLSAKIAAQLMMALGGQKVDVLLLEPSVNKKKIHDIADKQGLLL